MEHFQGNSRKCSSCNLFSLAGNRALCLDQCHAAQIYSIYIYLNYIIAFSCFAANCLGAWKFSLLFVAAGQSYKPHQL